MRVPLLVLRVDEINTLVMRQWGQAIQDLNLQRTLELYGNQTSGFMLVYMQSCNCVIKIVRCIYRTAAQFTLNVSYNDKHLCCQMKLFLW